MSVIDIISQLPEVSFAKGTEVITMGERPEKLYFLKSGRVEILCQGTRIALIKTPGSALGEMSLLLDVDATATVAAVDDAVFYVADDPIDFLKSNPDVNLHVSRIIALRLIAATDYLVDMKDQLKDCSDHVGMVDGVLDAILHRDLKKKITN